MKKILLTTLTTTIIFNWLKLNDYGYKVNTEIYIRKENISYYGIE